MSEFEAYLGIGFDHISDIQGYDHILFIVALCAIYKLSQWKQVLILVTAFTVGHSITLALSAFKILEVPQAITEFLIPLTILITALHNVFTKADVQSQTKINTNYILAVLIGFVHGMGFSNFLNALLGQAADIILPLFAFNVGLELGQLLIVFCILTVSFVVLTLFRAKAREWTLFISGAAAGISFIMMIERYAAMHEVLF